MRRRCSNFNILAMLLLIASVAFLARLRQADSRAAAAHTLIVAEFRPNPEGLGDYTDLFAYRFRRGLLESRRRVFGAPLSRKDNRYYHVRFDLGRNFIHANRYVVSGSGNVVDLKTGRLLTDHGDDFVKATPQALLFHRDNIDIGTGYLRLDLPSGNYSFDRGLSLPPGLLSKDLRHGLGLDRRKIPYAIEIADATGRTRVAIRDTGRGTRTFGSDLNSVPLMWTSNTTFAYARCDQQIATLYEYDLKLGRASQLGTIAGLSFASATDFWTDCEENVIFKCSKGSFKLDRAARRLVPYLIRPLGHEFQTTEQYQESQPLFFRGQNIGSIHCQSYNARTTDGYLAVDYREPGSNRFCPDGFKVWSSSTARWTTFKLHFFCNFVGWVDDPTGSEE